MHARLGAALAAVVLTFALGGPLVGETQARPVTVATASVTVGGIDPKCADYPCYTLTVLLQGLGSGRWQTIEGAFSLVPDGKIDCRIFQGAITADSTCSHEYVDLLRTGDVAFFYRVTPDFGSRACVAGVCKTEGQNFSDGIGPGGKSLLAGFNLQSYGLTVSATGAGSGFWSINPAGSPCGSGCTSYQYGTTVQIEAVPQGGSRFGGWTGACTGQQAQCLIGITGVLETAVIFELEGAEPTATPSVTATRKPSATAAASSSSTAEPATTTPSDLPGASKPVATPASGTDSPVASTSTGTPPALEPAAGDGRATIQVAIIAFAAGLLIAIGAWVVWSMRRRGPANNG